MRFSHVHSLLFAGLFFIIFLVGGFFLSRQKLLWNDELFTQQTAIDSNSYLGILTLKFPDGNKTPLFYVIQKTVCRIFSYHLPEIDATGLDRTRDIPSQVILRIPSNCYMSLALAVLFYYFTRFYSIYAALYALVIALVSPMVWDYWVEARPYPLWFLLTTLQLLLLSYAITFPGMKKVKSIFLTNLLLALTTPACVMQIFIVTLMLWWKGKYNIKQLSLIWIIPTAIALFYYSFHTYSKIKTYMFFPNLFDAVMPERLFVYVMYALTAWVLPEKYKTYAGNLFFVPVFSLFLASAVFILFLDIFTQNSDQGFFSRYLIYITPADVLMFTLASYDLRRWSRQNPWVCMNVSIFLGGLVIMRGLITYRTILAAATYLHSPAN